MEHSAKRLKASGETEQSGAGHALKQPLKELADLKFALDQSAIVAITDQRGIINYVNEKFCEISQYLCLSWMAFLLFAPYVT